MMEPMFSTLNRREKRGKRGEERKEGNERGEARLTFFNRLYLL